MSAVAGMPLDAISAPRRREPGGEPGVHAVLQPDLRAADASIARDRRVELPLPEELCRRLEQVTRGAGLLVYAVLAAAVKVAIRAHGDCEHVTILRPPLRGATVKDAAAVPIGYRITPDLTFRQLLEAVRGLMLPDVSASVRAAADPRCDQGHGVQESLAVAVALDELHEPILPTQSSTSLRFFRSAGRMHVVAEYPASLYREATIQRFLDHVVRIATRGLADPGLPVRRLMAPDEAERQTLLVNWTGGDVEIGAPLIHERIRDQAAVRPGAEALVAPDRVMTFAELDRAANRVALDLRDAGVRRGALVGIVGRREPSLVAAMLGVLRAGAAFVPVDAAFPDARTAQMLQHVSAILVPASLAGRVRDVAGPALTLHDLPPPEEASRHCWIAVDPDDAAYVLYTSGSTGVPKGVVVPHAGLSRLASHAHRDVLGLTAGVRVLQYASISVDAMIWDVLGTLANGATVCLAPLEDLLPGPALEHTLRATKANVVTVPPSSLAMLDPQVAMPDLRTIVVAGEACPAELAARWASRLQLFNAYGPTETTVCATIARLEGNEWRAPIGAPLEHVRACVVAPELSLVPSGVPGELYLGGAGLARGYLDAPDATAAAFVPDPFSGAPGRRLYRTGDIVRRRADGRLEFLGRRDQQIKVRGFRVEPEEIESQLRACPGVQDAAIVAAGAAAERQIIAYVVSAGELDTGALRAFLESRLPDHMVPSAFVGIGALPRTASGKVDRRSLPPWDPFSADHAPHRSWSNAVEELVARAWRDVLGPVGLGPDDDFFSVGGQSLSAIRVVSNINQLLGGGLASSAIFESRTVRRLAHRVLEHRRSDRAPLPPITPATDQTAGPLSHAQQRLWFQQELDPQNPAYNISGAVLLNGALNTAALQRSLATLVKRHHVWRTIFPTADGEPVQRVLPSGDVTLSIVDLTAMAEGARRGATRVVQTLAAAPFQLATQAPVRWVLVRLAPDISVLTLVVHHIVFDATSMEVLGSELSTCYRAYSAGCAPELPPLPVQYLDYARWERDHLEPAVVDGLTYWTRALADLPDLELPSDRPRPRVPSFRGAVQQTAVEADLLRQLETLARAAGATVYMAALAVFAGLLHRYAGQDTIAIGTSVANREREEVSGLIGFFLNMIVLPVRFEPTTTLESLLRQVRETALAGYQHAVVPLDRVVAELAVGRNPARQPLFSVALNLTDQPGSPIALDRLRCEPFEAGQVTAKFDLEMLLSRSRTGLDCSLIYSTDLFDDGTAALIAGDFSEWLRRFAAQPTAALSSLPISVRGAGVARAALPGDEIPISHEPSRSTITV